MHHTLPFVALKTRPGWRETQDEGDWDIFYACTGWIHENLPYAGVGGFRLLDHQKVNHFPNHIELTRKDLMAKNLKRTKRALEKEGRLEEAAEFEFFPTTFTLPSEGAMLLRAFQVTGGVWIMKPIGRAQGKGIFLVNRASQIESWLKERGKEKAENCCYENYVAQRYIDKPYTVAGRKFDLRLYCLVLSYNPLKVYLYREGFARFTAARYSNDDISNNFIHLTNHAIQKKDGDYDPTTTDLKWPVGQLKRYMTTMHGAAAVDRCFHGIQSLMVNSLRAVQNVMINDKHCFEMYGYDIMLDNDLKPWLIEVNASPSMTADTETDRALKLGLLDDLLTVTDAEGKYNGNPPRRVGGFDLIVDNGAVIPPDEPTSMPTMLGCANNRQQQLKKLNSKNP
eukprot:CAMPEP_0198219710 /NCGR_PEP_ID=MMETSP1445-20131203/75726_1 /TAXON_ID=36898 /ORGANISM="Pyramimonas sp., Strain CCMP2087" /LENGTH=395 /DNA_ID=CAMNT_0043897223 /DNA_START=218 /DNA_END=1405 /DNA_ORIENTATION=-